MKPMLEKCPVCGGTLAVTRLYCSDCDTTIEGHFNAASNPFGRLTPEQIQFVLTFVRCEGRLNRMEEELRLSYPTLRSRLLEIIRGLGFEPGKEEPPLRLTPDDRLKILEELSTGKISSEEAQLRLKGKKDDNAGDEAGLKE